MMHIVVVCGTNREGALSRLLATEVAESYKQRDHEVDLLDMKELPPQILAGTAYKEPDAAVTALVERFLKADGVVFVVPEYNGSYPGVLKLFVDMLPYPEGFDSRPCAFIGPGRWTVQGAPRRGTLSTGGWLSKRPHFPASALYW